MLALVIALAASLALAPPPASQFRQCNVPTGASASVLVPSSSAVLVSGEPLAAGDEVALLTPDGTCAGSVVWTGEPTALSAWRDNPYSSARDGFRPGETFQVAVWRASTQRMHTHDVAFVFEAKPNVAGVFQHDAIYSLKSQALSTSTAAGGEAVLALAPNWPNPFLSETTIGYTLPEQAHVTLGVYDLLGRLVSQLVDDVQSLGAHQVTFDGRGHASGTYVYRLVAGSEVSQRRMTLSR